MQVFTFFMNYGPWKKLMASIWQIGMAWFFKIVFQFFPISILKYEKIQLWHLHSSSNQPNCDSVKNDIGINNWKYIITHQFVQPINCKFLILMRNKTNFPHESMTWHDLLSFKSISNTKQIIPCACLWLLTYSTTLLHNIRYFTV